jgi:hypothetical protein
MAAPRHYAMLRMKMAATSHALQQPALLVFDHQAVLQVE